jgi:hypothetical protein
MSYAKSPTSHIRGSPYGKQLPDGPIQDLSKVLEKSTPEDWKKRTQALATLVASIPSGSEYSAEEAWYNSPAILRHLAWPLAELLKDPRSTVVMRTCESCAELFAKCQADARYLLKDLMPTVLACHSQTVRVIQSTVQDMMVDVLSFTPCKMAMPVWLDRLKSDKSRSVREACAMYLGIALTEWTEVGYLSAQIWEQVGTALTKALRDPAPQVRQQAKRGLESINQQQPDIFDRLVDNSDLVRDARVQKVLSRIQAGEAVADDTSVASSRAGSVGSRNRTGGGSRSITPRGTGRQSASESKAIPKTIGVTSPAPHKGGGLGPPVRVAGPFHAAVSSPPKIKRKAEEDKEVGSSSANGIATSSSDDPAALPAAANTSFDTTETNESDLPVIASADELREYAKSRGGSRRSSLLQERFARSHTQSSENVGSTLDLDEILNKESEDEEHNKDAADTNGGGTESHPPAGDSAPPVISISVPEHTRIAEAILGAHKKHVDLIMETLKVEMDALKEFELTMLEQGPVGRPTEDEVLEYFESVGLCVEQRAKAGVILQKKLDKISKGVM